MHLITKIKIRLWSRIISSLHMMYTINYMSNSGRPYLVKFKSSSVFLAFWSTFQILFLMDLSIKLYNPVLKGSKIHKASSLASILEAELAL